MYREDGVDLMTDPGKLFHYDRPMKVFPSLNLEGYPNRNSLVYESVYGIEGAQTILRGTLRFKGFCNVMRAMQEIGLFDDELVSEGGLRYPSWDHCLTELLGGGDAREMTENYLMHKIENGFSSDGARAAVDTMDGLGLFSTTEAPQGPTVIDALCAQLEKKLQYGTGERDMVLLSHEFVASWPDGTKSDITSTLVRCGDPDGYTAMAETVGIPCALGVEHVLRGTVSGAGVIRPVDRVLYEPLLADLEEMGICMLETEKKRN